MISPIIKLIQKECGKQEIKNVMGLDASLTNSGYAVRYKEEGKFHSITGIMKSPKVDARRLKYFYDEFKAKLAELDVNLIIKEGYAYDKANRSHAIGELGGVLALAAFENKVPIIFVAPTTLKKFITGSGKGKKSAIMKDVYKKWKFDTSDDNIADAYGLMKIGMAVRKFVNKGDKAFNKTLKYEKECLSTVLKMKIK